ncbi:hypothetical protein EYF80_001218 [Liparis tanakae]|uniref:Uncharacterized protein n=1 Tax=Liparis tanakae TaxID=230148 RepID=A0A4Z2JDW0_9TELE|nr:hypothetical protein EYF80_001218 [Liparis tanakae]
MRWLNLKCKRTSYIPGSAVSKAGLQSDQISRDFADAADGVYKPIVAVTTTSGVMKYQRAAYLGLTCSLLLLQAAADVTDIAPDHPARDIPRSSQSYISKRAGLLDEQLSHPIRVLQQASVSAFAPLVAN